ncbi:MAG: hypothetical protein R3F34_08515 [Planctomycetota bacterium]
MSAPDSSTPVSERAPRTSAPAPAPPADAPKDRSGAADQPTTLQRTLVALAALLALLSPFLLGIGDKSNELVGDGLVMVVRQPALASIPADNSNLARTLTTDWWSTLQPGTGLYRPIPSFLLGVGSLVASTGRDWAYDPTNPEDAALPYKLISAALKIICTLLVLEFAFVLAGDRRTAFVAALLFAVLPVHGMAVFDVAGVATTTATAFMLSAWILWLRAGEKPFERPGQLAGAAVCTLLAALSMETAFLLPLVILAVDAGRSKASGLVGGIKSALGKAPALLALVAALVVALGLRYAMTGHLLPKYLPGSDVENPLIAADLVTRFMDGLRLSLGGLLVIFGIDPLGGGIGLSADYSYPQVEVGNAFAWQNLVALVGWVVALGGVAVLFKKCRTRAGLLLGVLVASLACAQIVAPYSEVFEERLLFFPSAILVVLLATLVAPLLARFGRGGLVAVALVVVGLGYLDVRRAGHFADDEDLWAYTTRVSAPYGSRAHFKYGSALLLNDYPSSAAAAFERATDPRRTGTPLPNSWAFALAGISYLSNGDVAKAMPAFEKAVDIQIDRAGGTWEPTEWDAYQREDRVDVVLWQMTNTATSNSTADTEAHLAYLEGLLAKGYRSPYVELYRGDTLRKLGRTDEAEQAYAEGIAIAPMFSLVRAQGRLLRQEKRLAEAEKLYADQLARTDLTDSQRLEFKLLAADLAYSNGERDVATQRIEEVLASDPQDSVLARALGLQASILLDSAELAGSPVEYYRTLDEVARLLRRSVVTWGSDSQVTELAWQNYSYVLVELGRYRAAATFLRPVVAHTDSATLRHRLGRCLYWLADSLGWTGEISGAARQQLGMAAKELRDIALYPQLGDEERLAVWMSEYRPARLFELRALTRIARSGNKTAEASLQKELDLEIARAADEVGPRLVLMYLDVERGNYQSARKALEDLVTRVPGNADGPGGWNAMIAALDALQNAVTQVGVSPSIESLYNIAATQLFVFENYDGAQVALTEALALAKDDPKEKALCHELASQLVLKTRGPNEALEQVDEAIRAIGDTDPQLRQALESRREVFRAMIGTTGVAEGI